MRSKLEGVATTSVFLTESKMNRFLGLGSLAALCSQPSVRVCVPAACATLVLLCSQQAPSFAGQYQALCGGSNCTINVSPTQISSPFGTIPSKRVSSWGSSGEAKASIGTGIATTVILGPIGLLGFLAKSHQYDFTVNGFDELGKPVTMQFEFKNDRPAKLLMQEMVAVTGLGMGQTRTVEQIKAAESVVVEGLGAMPSQPTSIGPMPLGTTTKNVPSNPGKNCWSRYLDSNEAMKKWAESNPGQAAQNKKRFDDC